MTREEKIAELINIRDNFNYTLAPREVFDDAIKALKQEPILDKISDEIDQQEKWLMIAGYNAYNADIAFNAIKSEVAKYKAETER